MKKILGLTITTIIVSVIFWPAGIGFLLITIYTWTQENKKECALEAQINLIARQLGIEYGTPEEKLVQIAKLAANIKETGRE